MVSLVLVVVFGAALLAITATLRGGREGAAPAGAVAGATVGMDAAPAAPPSPATAVSDGPRISEDSGSTPLPSAGTGGTSERRPDSSAGRADTLQGRGQGQPDGGDVPAAVAAVTTREPAMAGPAAKPPYRLTAKTSEPTWIRVRTEDGQHLSEELVPAGQVRQWVSNRRFALRIGNAAGVRLELNGQPLPPLGRRGEMVERLVLPPPERP